MARFVRADANVALDGPIGVFTGAGLSAAAPASKPLGEAFHAELRRICFERAAALTPALRDPSLLDALRESRCNLLARIENTAPGLGAAALASMHVRIPNEAHLLAAVHLARGGMHVTMNFDDGVERAYGMLTGETELPIDAAGSLHEALAHWREIVPAEPRRLTVLSPPGGLRSSLQSRPLLVKLHGSLGTHVDGVTLPARAITDEPDAGDLGQGRRAAIHALARERHLLVTGFSGHDLGSRVAVLAVLRPGRFWWVTPAIAPEVSAAVSAVDPSQPMLGVAVDALRALLPMQPPSWPNVHDPGSDDGLQRWSTLVPAEVAAEAIAWALVDSGRLDESIAILECLVSRQPNPRTQLRLADALARRRWPGDTVRARRMDVRAAFAKREERGLRPFAIARWAESVLVERGIAGWRGRVQQVAAGLVAACVAASQDPQKRRTRRIQATSIAVTAVLPSLEHALPGALDGHAMRLCLATVARLARRVARGALRSTASGPSGRRRATLWRQAVEIDTIVALLDGSSPSKVAADSLVRLEPIFDHLGDRHGLADAIATRALVQVASGEATRALEAVREASRLRPDVSGVVQLASSLVVRSATTVLDDSDGSEAEPEPDRARPHVEALRAFVLALPKVELHAHLEGSITPPTLANLARRNEDARVPWTAAEVRRWYVYRHQIDFLNAHVLAAEQLRRPDDLVAVALELGATLAAENVRYAEVAVSPSVHLARGMRPDELFHALETGRDLVARRHNVDLRWSVTAGTRRGPNVANAVLEAALAHRTPGIVSFGLGGLETAASRAQFAAPFALAREAGLRRVAHAGELGGPVAIWHALDVLGVERIGHGIASVGDNALLERLRTDGTPLEVCPWSNVQTGVVPCLSQHPLPRLLRRGVAVNLGTDDPAMFHTSVARQYVDVAGAFALGPAGVRDLVRAGVRASFLPTTAVEALLAEIDAVPIPATTNAA